jgi:hypothetical protein
VPLSRAEQLKIEHGSALVEEADKGQQITISNELGMPLKVISRENLRRIMSLRLEEIFQLIAQDIEQADAFNYSARPVFLCGGGARIPNIAKLAEQVLQMPVSVGKTNSVSGLKSPGPARVCDRYWPGEVWLFSAAQAFHARVPGRRDQNHTWTNLQTRMTSQSENMSTNASATPEVPVDSHLWGRRCRLSVIERLISDGLPAGLVVAVNTGGAELERCGAARCVRLESKRLRGLGSGGDPERGRRAAEEKSEELKGLCEGAEVVFIAAGLGGGSGTGISPVLARIAKAAGALVLAFVTTPFGCEGTPPSIFCRPGPGGAQRGG